MSINADAILDIRAAISDLESAVLSIEGEDVPQIPYDEAADLLDLVDKAIDFPEIQDREDALCEVRRFLCTLV